jgi:hypothetical protein
MNARKSLQLGPEMEASCGIRGTERNSKTRWRWTQSRANFSPGPISLLIGKNTGNITPSIKKFRDNSAPDNDLAGTNWVSRAN